MSQLMTLLASLERQWRRLGVPTDKVMNVGREPDEIRRELRETIGSVHEDVVTWFSWHDGSLMSLEWIAAPTGHLLPSLEDSLFARRQDLTISDGLDWEGRVGFQPHWLPITTSNMGERVLDCKTGELRYVDWHDADFSWPISENLQGAVRAWVGLLERDLFAWLPDSASWHYDWSTLAQQVPRGLAE